MSYIVPPQRGNSRDRSYNERSRILIIGSRDGVTEIIHTLHRLGFADAGAWSSFLPAPNSDDVMSILTKQRSS